MCAVTEFSPALNSHHGSIIGELTIRVSSGEQTLMRDRRYANGTSIEDIERVPKKWAIQCMKGMDKSGADLI